MVNKKAVFFIVFVFSILLLVPQSGLSSSEKSKIDFSVMEDLEVSKKTQVIIGYNEEAGSNANERSFSAKSSGPKILHRFQYSNSVLAEVTEEELAALESDPNVRYVESNTKHTYHAMLQDSLDIVNATKTWNIQTNSTNITGANQIVCVIDSGIDFHHPDFWGNYSIESFNESINITNTTSGYFYYERDLSYNIFLLNSTGMSSDESYPVRFSFDNSTWFNDSEKWNAPYYNNTTLYYEINISSFSENSTMNLTGISANLALDPKIVDGYDFCADNVDCSSEDDYPEDLDGHGTHVAGIIAANGGIQGVAPDAKLVVVKILNSTGGLKDTTVFAQGVEWCTNYSVNTNSVSAMSVSVGTSSTYSSYCDSTLGLTTLGAAFQEAVNNNISSVIATGNTNVVETNKTSGVSAPACFENVTRVSATDKSYAFASYAFRHQYFTDILLAPGSSINSTYLTATYASISGTSMACPHVSGIIALMSQSNELNEVSKTPAETEQVLLNSGFSIEDSASGANYTFVDAYASVNSAPVIDFWQIETMNGSRQHSIYNNSLGDYQIDVYISNVSSWFVENNVWFDANASDVNSDTLTYYWVSDLFNSSCTNGECAIQTFSGWFEASDEGNHTLNLTVSDGTTSTTIEFNLTVHPDVASAVDRYFEQGDLINFTFTGDGRNTTSTWYDNSTANISLTEINSTEVFYLNTSDWTLEEYNISVYFNVTDNETFENSTYMNEFSFELNHIPVIDFWKIISQNKTGQNATYNNTNYNTTIYAYENISKAGYDDNAITNFSVSGSDGDGDNLTYYLYKDSEVLNYNGTDYLQNFTKWFNSSDSGNYTLSIIASDLKANSTITLNLSVVDEYPPSFTQELPDDDSISEDEGELSYNVSQYVNNVDSDVLDYDYAMTNGEDIGFSIGSDGILEATFACDEAGDYDLNILVSDGWTTIVDNIYLDVSSADSCDEEEETTEEEEQQQTTTQSDADSGVSYSRAYSSLNSGEVQSYEISKNGIPVTKVVFKPNANLEEEKITIKGYDSKPSAVSSAPGTAYKYFSVTTTSLGDNMNYAKLTIKIPKSWISSNNIQADSISVLHNSGSGWEKLSITKEDENTAEVYYSFVTTSFSYFAISGNKIASASDSSEDAPSNSTNESELLTGNSISEKSVFDSFSGFLLNHLIIIAFVLVVLAAIVVVVLIKTGALKTIFPRNFSKPKRKKMNFKKLKQDVFGFFKKIFNKIKSKFRRQPVASSSRVKASRRIATIQKELDELRKKLR